MVDFREKWRYLLKESSFMGEEEGRWFSRSGKDRRSLIEIKMVRSLSQQSAEQQVLKEYPDNGNDSPRMTVDCSPIR